MKEKLLKRQKRKEKQCHACDSLDTVVRTESFYGHRRGVYVGVYIENFYACDKHPKYWDKQE